MTLALALPQVREGPPLDQVVSGPITFVAHCDRQGIPYFGHAYVGYVPSGARVSDTTLRRMVQSAAREGEQGLERQLAKIIETWAKPEGVAILVRTAHGCGGPRLLADEGYRQLSLWRGSYRGDRSLRAAFLSRCRG